MFTDEVMYEKYICDTFSRVHQLPFSVSPQVIATGDQMKRRFNFKLKLFLNLKIVGNL